MGHRVCQKPVKSMVGPGLLPFKDKTPLVGRIVRPSMVVSVTMISSQPMIESAQEVASLFGFQPLKHLLGSREIVFCGLQKRDSSAFVCENAVDSGC
jgi:hypothetical protein